MHDRYARVCHTAVLDGIIRSIHRRLELLVDRHPAGGYFELVFDGDFINLHCRWPFDLVEDEWISIQNRYHVSSYRQAVDNAIANGIGKASGVDGGSLEIASQNDGFTIEFSRPQTGWSASSLQLHVRRPIVELLLQARLSRLCIFGPRHCPAPPGDQWLVLCWALGVTLAGMRGTGGPGGSR